MRKQVQRGPPGGSKRKKEKDPFWEAFGRVKDHWSVLPRISLLALTATVQNNGRAKLNKACAMVQPVIIVDVLPNKENITFNFMSIPNEKEAVSHLK